VDVLAEVDGK
jgi:hypothetical protein